MSTSACGTSRRIKAQQPSLLAGLVYDGEDRPMTPSHATKSGRCYRYYITRPDALDGSAAWRVSAHDLERLVCERLSALLADQHAVANLAGDDSAEAVQQVLGRADLIAAALRSGTAQNKLVQLAVLLKRIDLRDDEITLTTDRAGLNEALGLLDDGVDPQPLVLSLAAVKLRRGHQLRLVIPGPMTISIDAASRDGKLVELVAEAQRARSLVLAAPEKSIAAFASEHGRCRTRLGKIVGLACLAPDIVTAIVEGRQPPTLTPSKLQAIDLPLCWAAQRTMLGFS